MDVVAVMNTDDAPRGKVPYITAGDVKLSDGSASRVLLQPCTKSPFDDGNLHVNINKALPLLSKKIYQHPGQSGIETTQEG